MAQKSGANPMGPVEWGLLITLSILWGGSFFFAEVALEELPPLTIVWARVAIGAVVLWLVLKARGLVGPKGLKGWAPFALMGLINNVIPFSLIVWGQASIASGLAAILNATTPIFTVIVAHYLTVDERITPQRVAGVLFGVAGVAALMGPAAFSGEGAFWAQMAILGAAISYAFASVYGRRFKGEQPLRVATGQVTASALLLAPIAFMVDEPWNFAMPSLPVWASLIGIGALATSLAYIIYFRILATAGATNLMLVTFLVPVSAVLLGVFVLGEAFETRHMLGMGLISLGLAAIDGRALKLLGLKRS